MRNKENMLNLENVSDEELAKVRTYLLMRQDKTLDRLFWMMYDSVDDEKK